MRVSVRQILLLIPVMVIVAAGYAVIKPEQPAIPVAVVKAVDPREGILEELSTVLRKMDTLTVLTIDGTITARDLADSTRNMETTFCYCRNGQEAYYRIGQQEMLSLQDAYIVVAHDVRKVFLGAPRAVVNPVKFPIGKEAALLAEEGYEITRRVYGTDVHISLLNRRHPTCRAYDITFDTTGWIKETFMRVADEGNPVDSTSDKFIGVRISHFEPGVIRKDLLKSGRYITVSNGAVKPAPSLSGYELIKDR